MKAAVVFVFSLAVLSCSYRPGDDGSGSNPLSSPTAKDLWEAETIALYLSGEMLAPPDLAQQVLEELASIRSAFGDARPEIRDIRFWPPWRPGSVILYFDEATKGSVASGTYSPWDELNQRYGLTRLDLTFLEDNSFVILFFGDPLHPRRLEEKYALLPGVSRTNPRPSGTTKRIPFQPHLERRHRPSLHVLHRRSGPAGVYGRMAAPGLVPERPG
jgi:hypothetical protein